MILTVYHEKEPRFSINHSVKSLEGFEMIARVKLPDTDKDAALERAFELTNHIHQNWTLNKEIVKAYKEKNRSTSVGDLIECKGIVYQVGPFGFHEAFVLTEEVS